MAVSFLEPYGPSSLDNLCTPEISKSSDPTNTAQAALPVLTNPFPDAAAAPLDNRVGVLPAHNPEKPLVKAMAELIHEREACIDKALKDRSLVSEGIVVGQDVFNMGYLAFTAVKAALPGLAGMGAASLVLGEVVGVINIGFGVVSLVSAVKAFQVGNNKLGARLLLQGLANIILGSVMFLGSLALKVGALAGLAAFLTTNPWILPLIFLVIALSQGYEIYENLHHVNSPDGIAAKLKGNELGNLIKSAINDPKDSNYSLALGGLDQLAAHEIKGALKERFDKLTEMIGFSAGLAAFKLMHKHLDEKESDMGAEKAVLESMIQKRKVAQYLRVAEIALNLLTFGVSFSTLSPKVDATTLSIAQHGTMAALSLLPIGINVKFPLDRETPIIPV